MREPEYVEPGAEAVGAQALGAEAPGTGEEMAAPGRAPRRRRSAVAIVALVGLAVGALGTGGVLAAIEASERAAAGDPVVVAEAYVTAIAEQDAEAANAMLLPDAAAASTALLDDAVLSAAMPIELPRVAPSRVQSAGGTEQTIVAVTFVLGGEEVERGVALERDGPRWRIASTLAQPVRLAIGAVPVRIGDALLPAPTAEGPIVAWLYPGVYRPEPQDSALLATSAEPFTVTGADDPVRVEPQGMATEALQLQVGDAIDAALVACVDAGCPTVQPAGAGPGSVVDITVLDASGSLVQSGIGMLETTVSVDVEVVVTLDAALATAAIDVLGKGLP